MYNKESQRASLSARRETVKGEIISTLGRIQDDRLAALVDQVHDTKDHAVSQLLVESGNADLKRAANELQDIDAALLRITAGTYGRCIACGTDIPAGRLAAYPTAKRCLPCQEQHEKNR